MIKYLIIFLICFRSLAFGQVPIVGAKLSDVVTEIGLGSTASLDDCFDNANASGFDPTYEGSKDRLSNFRNYQNCSWNLDCAAYANKSFNTSTQVGSGKTLRIENNGTKLYVLNENDDRIYQYTLSTAYDISTASYDSKNFLNVLGTKSFYINEAGTKLYIIQPSSVNVREYTISIPYDISSVTTQDNTFFYNLTNANDMSLADSGNKMYIINPSNSVVDQYTLSTAYDISTAAKDNKSYDFGSNISGFAIKDDGKSIFTINQSTNIVTEFTMSTPFDISTTSGGGKTFSVGTQETSPSSIVFESNGSRMYVLGANSRVVYQYNLE